VSLCAELLYCRVHAWNAWLLMVPLRRVRELFVRASSSGSASPAGTTQKKPSLHTLHVCSVVAFGGGVGGVVGAKRMGGNKTGVRTSRANEDAEEEMILLVNTESRYGSMSEIDLNALPLESAGRT
jgi:hypothetical protein